MEMEGVYIPVSPPLRQLAPAYFRASLVTFLVLSAWLMLTGANTLRSVGADGQWKRGLTSIDPSAVFEATAFDTYRAEKGFLLHILLINTPQVLLNFSTSYSMAFLLQCIRRKNGPFRHRQKVNQG